MGNFFRVQEFVKGVQARSGQRLLSYVMQFKEDAQVRNFLIYTYDTKNFVYGVKPSVEPQDIHEQDELIERRDIIKLFNGINTLDEQRVSSDATNVLATTLIHEFGMVALSILNRKIPNASLGRTTINKAIPGLIEEFKVMKAKDLDWDRLISGLGYSVERKYDGNNIYIIDGLCYTRSGHRVHLPNVEAFFKSAPLIKDTVCVTECCVREGKLGDRARVQGLITRGRKRSITQYEQDELNFRLIDCISIEEWRDKKCHMPYNARLKVVDTLVKKGYFLPVYREIYTSKDIDKMKVMLAKDIADGYEGIVVKPLDFLYKWGRSWDWMRYKEAKTADLLVVGWVYGKGTNSAKLGALTCTGKIGDCDVRVNIGQGFTDMQREPSYADNLVGKIIEVTYNEITPDGSLNIPLFIDVREDKEDSDNA